MRLPLSAVKGLRSTGGLLWCLCRALEKGQEILVPVANLLVSAQFLKVATF